MHESIDTQPDLEVRALHGEIARLRSALADAQRDVERWKLRYEARGQIMSNLHICYAKEDR